MTSWCLPVYDYFQCSWTLELYHSLVPGYLTLTVLIFTSLISTPYLREEVSILFLHSHPGGGGTPHGLLLFGPIPKVASFLSQAGLS